MNGYLVFSSVGEFHGGDSESQTLIIHRTVRCDCRLDTRDIAIHTQWILFDEPIVSRIGVWTNPEEALPVFEVAQVLEPLPGADTVARVCTVSVRLQREKLVPLHLYWVKVFRNGELATQYPIKLASEDFNTERPRLH